MAHAEHQHELRPVGTPASDRRRRRSPSTPKAGRSASSSAKPAAFEPTDEERGHRDRRARVDVGRPHVERHRRDLVAEARQHRARARRTARSGSAASMAPAPACDAGVVHAAGEAEEPAHAVDHRARGDAAVDQVLERRLARAPVVAQEAGQDVRGEADELERQVGHQQVRRRRHQEHAERAREQERVVLALVRSAAHLGRARATSRPPPAATSAEQQLEEDAEGVERRPCAPKSHACGSAPSSPPSARSRPAAGASRRARRRRRRSASAPGRSPPAAADEVDRDDGEHRRDRGPARGAKQRRLSTVPMARYRGSRTRAAGAAAFTCSCDLDRARGLDAGRGSAFG